MATHSSILTWKSLWTEEPDSLQFMGLQEVKHDLVTEYAVNTHVLITLILQLKFCYIFFSSIYLLIYLSKIHLTFCAFQSKLQIYSVMSDFVSLWTISRQSPLSMEFSRQEYWSEVPFPPPGGLLDPGIKPMSLAFLALAGEFFTTTTPGNPDISVLSPKYFSENS